MGLIAAVTTIGMAACSFSSPDLTASTNAGEMCLQLRKPIGDYTHGMDHVRNSGDLPVVIHEVVLRNATGIELVEVFQSSVHADDGLLWSTLSGWPAQEGELRPLSDVIEPDDDAAIVVHLRRTGDGRGSSMDGLTINYTDDRGNHERTLMTESAFRLAVRC